MRYTDREWGFFAKYMPIVIVICGGIGCFVMSRKIKAVMMVSAILTVFAIGLYVYSWFRITFFGNGIVAFIISFVLFAAISVAVFEAGFYLWYKRYVTEDIHKKVRQRYSALTGKKSTVLLDKESENLGPYESTKSDWVYDVNKDIMSWKISKAIMAAEGEIRNAPWYWKYFPGGKKLKCEPWEFAGFARGLKYIFLQGRNVGGSTPVLQAAKNFYKFARKITKGTSKLKLKFLNEMPTAYSMCQQFHPKQLMAIYMATAHAGYSNYFGIHRTSLYYYGTQYLDSLDWNQAIVIAAGLPNPSRLNPWRFAACRLSECATEREEKLYKQWLKRIKEIKKLVGKAYGVEVENSLPKFYNNLNEATAVSSQFPAHDAHIRNWVSLDMPKEIRNWEMAGYAINLTYNKALTKGTKSNPNGLAALVKQEAETMRQYIKKPLLQISYALIDSTDGAIVSQYGGDETLGIKSIDMSMAKKPVCGSAFKVITSFAAAKYWPDSLPIINFGKNLKSFEWSKNRKVDCGTEPELCTQVKRFCYHLKCHWVKNDHAMPFYPDKPTALAQSANIGFVFISLRYTWLVDQAEWLKMLKTALIQMYREKADDILSPMVTGYMLERKGFLKDPLVLRKFLVKYMGYLRYIRPSQLRQQAIFEAAKSAAIKKLMDNPVIQKKDLLALLDKEQYDSILDLSNEVKAEFEAQKQAYRAKFSGSVTFKELSWSRELRMEVGLRYIIHIAKVLGFNMRNGNLTPVITMTLGVSDWTTRELAAAAASVSAGKRIFPFFINDIYFEDKENPLYKREPKTAALSISSEKVKNYMQKVLTVEEVNEKGKTAKRYNTGWQAGKYISKKFGEEILSSSGAKTGTMQNSEGVSCLGFMEHRAGAVTISFPKKERVCRRNTRKCISSGKACLLLFKLLSHWKDYDQEREKKDDSLMQRVINRRQIVERKEKQSNNEDKEVDDQLKKDNELLDSL